jgi:hypothetical protein
MMDPQQASDDALQKCDTLIKLLRKKKTQQIWTADERGAIKATCLTWFSNQRPCIQGGEVDLRKADSLYQDILKSSAQAASRAGYKSRFKQLRAELLEIRSRQMLAPAPPLIRPDAPPSFAGLISDPEMQDVLARRWRECVACTEGNAPMAAVVMMGGLIEGLLLARVNKEPDKRPIFTANAAPKDRGGTPLRLNEWMLKDYIDVAHELKWITRSAKDVSSVLRDYRNYIHPQKELSHGVVLTKDDSKLLWEIAKGIATQLL